MNQQLIIAFALTNTAFVPGWNDIQSLAFAIMCGKILADVSE
jgi:hypothetical protein